ncbi:MAG: DNA polymerase IV [Pirellulales bacterium]|nr:DNA polymerase IV [Pirellulales bacterium]
MPLVGHIDADCFYVSCERARFPHLREQPVGVLSNQGACVIAKSYELKACGVTTGMPIWDAVPLCPEAVFVKRDYAWYEVLSRRLLEVVRSVSPSVEYYSIDEQFFDAACLEMSFRAPLPDAARGLQQRVLLEVGIPVSVGVARTKTLAKLASSFNKPFGCAVFLDPEETAEFFADIPVEKVTGIAIRSKQRLAIHGIHTCGDFVAADRRLIRKLLTKSGEELWWELRGTVTKPILTSRTPHKYISRGGSVGRATADRDRLDAWLVRNTERLIEALDIHRVFCNELRLILRYKSGPVRGACCHVPQSTADFRTLLEAGRQLFFEVWSPGIVVQYMHLIAGKLCWRDWVQQSLFGGPTSKEKRIAEAKRLINHRIRRFALRSAATLPLDELYHDEASDYDVCDIYGKTCF